MLVTLPCYPRQISVGSFLCVALYPALFNIILKKKALTVSDSVTYCASMIEKLLTMNEAAELLRVHPRTLARWAKEGRIPVYKFADRQTRRFKASDIQSFIESHTVAV